MGGDRFLAHRVHLEKYPSTRLGKLMRAGSLREIHMYCDEFVPGIVTYSEKGAVLFLISG